MKHSGCLENHYKHVWIYSKQLERNAKCIEQHRYKQHERNDCFKLVPENSNARVEENRLEHETRKHTPKV